MNRYFTTESISVIFSVISLVFAIWQYSQNKKIIKMISLEVVELHKNVSMALGATQSVKTLIRIGQSPCIEVGRAEGLCQAVLHESAKLYCNLANTSINDIDNLIKDGQLDECYKKFITHILLKKRSNRF